MGNSLLMSVLQVNTDSYKVNRIPMDYIGFSNTFFWGQRNRITASFAHMIKFQSAEVLATLITVINE